jgi:hypothetical protein
VNPTSNLPDLRAEFLADSMQSMPIAGIIFWVVIGVAALKLPPGTLAFVVGFGSGMIFPLGVLLDRLIYKRKKLSSTESPVAQLFMQCLALVALLWPFVILASLKAHEPILVVLGGAILMGIVWIPYGWCADDPVGLQHAIGRCVLCYIAYVYVPAPYKATAISAAVILAYLYSLIRMRRPQSIKAIQTG